MLRNSSGQKGTTLIEVLIAGLILAVGIMGVVNLWAVSFRLTLNTTDIGIAYNLGRQAVERTKQSGFRGAHEGTIVTYYTATGEIAPSRDQSRYVVTITVQSDPVENGSPGPNSVRIVRATVTLRVTGDLLYATATYLVRGGI